MSLPDTPTGTETAKPRPIYRDLTVLQLAALVLALDQFTKYLVIQLLSPGMSFPFRGFFRFTHVHNTGSAFGILQGLNTPLIFISFIGIIILVLIYRSQPHPSNWLRLSLGLQLGGAFGNLIDRIRLGYVTDFIDVGPWPVFNLADASIVTGLILLAWVLMRNKTPQEQAASVGDSGTTGSEVTDEHKSDDASIHICGESGREELRSDAGFSTNGNYDVAQEPAEESDQKPDESERV